MEYKLSPSNLKTPKKRNSVLRASEIGQFHYCSISWYLRRCGHQPKSPMLKVGETKHKKLGQTIYYLQRKESHSKILNYIAYILIASIIFLIIN